MMPTTIRNAFEAGAELDGKWVITELIGRGGMSEVYRARRLSDDSDVAIKVVSHDWIKSCAGNEVEAQNAIERSRREFQTMAQIRHTNVVGIVDSGTIVVKQGDKQSPIEYLVMEYMKEGRTVGSTIPTWGFYPNEDRMREWLTDFFLPVLDGVQALHEHGIIHRDLKPDNILLDGKTPKIADFWLARSSRMDRVTRTFEFKGTPSYMSPEHFFNMKGTDWRADIYSLGKILYEAVSGNLVHKEMSFKTAALPLAETAFFKKLDRIIQDATAEDRESRIASVKDLREVIERAIRNEPDITPRPKRSIAGRLRNWILKIRPWNQLFS